MADFNGLSRILGSESIAVGRVVELAPNLGNDITIEGMRFLQEGTFETNPANFDNTLFASAIRAYAPLITIPRLIQTTITTAQIDAYATSSSGKYMAVIATNGTTTAARTGAVYYSNNYGKTWSYIGDASNVSSNAFQGGICVDEDGNVGWVHYFGGTGSRAWVYQAATDVLTSQLVANQTYSDIACAPTGGTFVVTGGSTTAYRFSSGSWATVTTTGSTQPRRVFTYDGTTWIILDVTGTTLSRSTNGGSTWASVTIWSGSRQALDIDSGDGVTMVVTSATNDIIARTTNGGASWSEVTLSPATANPYSVVIATSATNYVMGYYTGNNAIVYSTDGGATWASSALNISVGSSADTRAGINVGMAHAGGGRLLIPQPSGGGGAGGGFYESTDHGATWTTRQGYFIGPTIPVLLGKRTNMGRLLTYVSENVNYSSTLYMGALLDGPVAGLPISQQSVIANSARYMRIA